MRQRFTSLVRSGFVSAVVSIGLVLGMSAPASAVTIWTYTGNSFTAVKAPYTTQDRVSATLTLSGPLPAGLTDQDITSLITAVTMSDGVQTQTLATTPFGGPPFFSTDNTGQITAWSLGLLDSATAAGIQTLHGIGGINQDVGQINIDTFATVMNNPGQWVQETPEPGTATLLALGLLAVGRVRRRNF